MHPVQNVYEPLDSSNHNKCTPTHQSYQVRHYPTTSPTLAWLLSLLVLLAASQGDTFLVPPASSVYHTMAEGSSAGIDYIFPTAASLAVIFGGCRLSCNAASGRSFGGFGPSPTPPTRLEEGSLRVKH